MATRRSSAALLSLVDATRGSAVEAGVRRRIDRAVRTIDTGPRYGRGSRPVYVPEAVARRAEEHAERELADRFRRFAA
ncbi:hypothetical protein [Kitasatospora griseola]|uniref:hypothetical protein n=1 Tax=Kitasatospora griseola TaxID=2064 RepID=UPI0037F2FC56